MRVNFILFRFILFSADFDINADFKAERITSTENYPRKKYYLYKLMRKKGKIIGI